MTVVGTSFSIDHDPQFIHVMLSYRMVAVETQTKYGT
jgi:hypothetical protein